jgi:lipoate-protein ligase A
MEVKVSGGKLVRLVIEGSGPRRITLSGDFFVYPEEGIFILEDVLSGLGGHEPLDAVESVLRDAVVKNRIELVGVDEGVIARLYKGALLVEGC